MIKFTPDTATKPIEPAKSQPNEKAAQRLKLKHATEAFESIFIAQMLKSMRSSALNPDSEDGFGKDVMLSMADESVSNQLAKSGMLGVGDILYEHLLHKLELEEAMRQSDGSGVSDLKVPHYIPRVVSLAPDATEVAGEAGHWKTRFRPAIEQAARSSELPARLIEAVISAESGGNPGAVSRKGALGLMQLMRDTATAVGVSDPLDPVQNIAGGAKYLRRMLDRFGDLPTALAAYNAGPTAVERHGGMPPYSETRAYVERIMKEISDVE